MDDLASVMPQIDELHAGSPSQSVHSESILLLPGGGLEAGYFYAFAGIFAFGCAGSDRM